MASSGSSNGSNELYTANIGPTGTDFEDNATHIVTDDGTPTGEPIEMWKFDAESGTWIQIPLGGEDCPAAMTRTALLALRNSASLSKDCHYVITDYTRQNVGPSQILIHAVDERTLSMSVHVSTGYDNLAWEGTYNIDTNRIESLHDNIGNDVYGEASVDAFPWGVAAVSENEVREGRLVYIDGSVTENYIGSSATLTVRAGTVAQNTIEHSANVTVSGGTFQDNTVANDASVTITQGSNIENVFGASTTYNQVGTGYIRYSTVDGNSTITNGNVNITNSTFQSASTFNSTGSTGTVSNSTFSYGRISVTNIPDLTLSQFTAQSGEIFANNAARLDLYRSSASSAGRFLVSANARLDCSYCEPRSYGYIQVTQGSLIATYTEASSLGYVSHQSSGDNRVDRSHASAQGNIRFLNSATGGRVYYSTAQNGGTIYQSGSSTNCYHYYCTAQSSSLMYIENGVNARHYYNTAESFSYIRNYGASTGQSIMYYCTASARGFIGHNAIGARIRFYAVHVSSQSIARQTGGTAIANLYYSSFTAYYYALLVLTGGTRSGLFGSGRQSFNGMPASNGTGARNWT